MRTVVLGFGCCFGLAALCLLNTGLAASAPAAGCASPPPELGKFERRAEPATLPAAAYFDADGRERPMAELRGTPLLVNFWATWCAPCVKEMPSLDRLAERGAADELQVLPLSADREGAAVVRAFYETNGLRHLPIAIDKMSRVARAAKVAGLPTTILYASDGQEVGRVVGVAEWDAPAVHAFLARCLRPSI